MALFSDKIETAYYINPEKTDVEIIYTQGDKHIAYAIQVDFEHPDFKDLLEEVSLDQLDKNTNQRLKQQSETFGNAVNHAVSVYMETEFKERKEQIEKDLDDFRTEWFANRDKEYKKKYGKNISDQHKDVEKEWAKLEEQWQRIKIVDDNKTQLNKKHKSTLKKLEKVAKDFEKFLEEQTKNFKNQFNVDSKWSKEEIDEQHRQMVDHYDTLKKQTEDLQNSIGFNYPSYIGALLERTTQEVVSGKEASKVADAIVKDIIQSNTIAALASHKKIDSDLLSIVMDNESEAAKEEMFKLKLAIFEMELVKESKDKELKAKIRKAKTKLETLVEFSKLLDNV